MQLPLKELKDFYDNDLDLIKELIEQFKNDAPKGLQDLEESIKKQDYAKIAATAHKLVGSSGLLQLEDMTTLFKAMEEKASDKESMEKLSLLFQKIEQSFKALMRTLETPI